MPRTPGATNRTARELDTASKHLKEKAALKRRVEALKKANEDLKAKRKASQK